MTGAIAAAKIANVEPRAQGRKDSGKGHAQFELAMKSEMPGTQTRAQVALATTGSSDRKMDATALETRNNEAPSLADVLRHALNSAPAEEKLDRSADLKDDRAKDADNDDSNQDDAGWTMQTRFDAAMWKALGPDGAGAEVGVADSAEMSADDSPESDAVPARGSAGNNPDVSVAPSRDAAKPAEPNLGAAAIASGIADPNALEPEKVGADQTGESSADDKPTVAGRSATAPLAAVSQADPEIGQPPIAEKPVGTSSSGRPAPHQSDGNEPLVQTTPRPMGSDTMTGPPKSAASAATRMNAIPAQDQRSTVPPESAQVSTSGSARLVDPQMPNSAAVKSTVSEARVETRIPTGSDAASGERSSTGRSQTTGTIANPPVQQADSRVTIAELETKSFSTAPVGASDTPAAEPVAKTAQPVIAAGLSMSALGAALTVISQPGTEQRATKTATRDFENLRATIPSLGNAGQAAPDAVVDPTAEIELDPSADDRPAPKVEADAPDAARPASERQDPSAMKPSIATPAPIIQQTQPLPATPAGTVIAALSADPSWSAYFRDTQPGAPAPARSLKIQLNPSELGMVTAHLLAGDDGLSVELVAETADAQTKLSADSEMIARSLRAIGIDVDRVTVQLSIRNDAPAQADVGQPRGFASEPGAGGAHGDGNGERNGQAGGQPQSIGSNQQSGSAASATNSGRYI